MKTKLILLGIALLAVMAIAACPPQPQCGEGEITVEEAQYIPEVTHQECIRWRWNWHTWDWECTKTKTVVDQQEGWTAPVCRVQVEACMDETALNYAPGADIDNRELCLYEEVKQGCAFTMYVLEGTIGNCSLTRGIGDEKSSLPARFNGTDYMQTECNKCRTTPFKWTGEWTTTCEVPCVNCE